MRIGGGGYVGQGTVEGGCEGDGGGGEGGFEAWGGFNVSAATARIGGCGK